MDALRPRRLRSARGMGRAARLDERLRGRLPRIVLSSALMAAMLWALRGWLAQDGEGDIPGLAILVFRLPAGAASSTPSSIGSDHSRRTSKPYAHPAVYRSRFSCGIVHPTGAASPDPSSTTSDLAHRHRCA